MVFDGNRWTKNDASRLMCVARGGVQYGRQGFSYGVRLFGCLRTPAFLPRPFEPAPVDFEGSCPRWRGCIAKLAFCRTGRLSRSLGRLAAFLLTMILSRGRSFILTFP